MPTKSWVQRLAQIMMLVNKATSQAIRMSERNTSMSKLMRFAQMEKTKNNVSKNQEQTWAKQHPAMFSRNPRKVNQIGRCSSKNPKCRVKQQKISKTNRRVKTRRHRRHKSQRMKDGIQNFPGYWEVREGWVGFRVSNFQTSFIICGIFQNVSDLTSNCGFVSPQKSDV